MKASPIMVFEYAGMLGVPALLIVLAVFSAAGVGGALRTVLLLLIAAGCLVYGSIAVREVYGHGSGRGTTRGAGPGARGGAPRSGREGA